MLKQEWTKSVIAAADVLHNAGWEQREDVLHIIDFQNEAISFVPAIQTTNIKNRIIFSMLITEYFQSITNNVQHAIRSNQ